MRADVVLAQLADNKDVNTTTSAIIAAMSAAIEERLNVSGTQVCDVLRMKGMHSASSTCLSRDSRVLRVQVVVTSFVDDTLRVVLDIIYPVMDDALSALDALRSELDSKEEAVRRVRLSHKDASH